MARKLSAQQIEDGTASYTAEELTETAHGFVEAIRLAASTETRKEFADALAELAKATQKRIVSCMQNDQRAVTDDFRAGLAFAAELLADVDNFDA